MIEFFVPGKPAPQGSKRHVGNGVMVESSAKTLRPWRQAVALHAGRHARTLLGAVAVHLTFVMPRPKSTPKTLPTPPAIKRPDIDKLERAVLDGLTGVCFVDDSQVTHLSSRKRIAEPGEPTGVHIAYGPDTDYAPRSLAA